MLGKTEGRRRRGRQRMRWLDGITNSVDVCVCVCVCVLSCFRQVRLFATLQTVACQAPLSMGSSRQEYRSGLQGPPLEDLLNPRIESVPLMSHTLAGRDKFEQTPEDSEGQGSLAFCSPGGCKESNTTYQLKNNRSFIKNQALGLYRLKTKSCSQGAHIQDYEKSSQEKLNSIKQQCQTLVIDQHTGRVSLRHSPFFNKYLLSTYKGYKPCQIISEVAVANKLDIVKAI